MFWMHHPLWVSGTRWRLFLISEHKIILILSKNPLFANPKA
jgi:hypothetical protein